MNSKPIVFYWNCGAGLLKKLDHIKWTLAHLSPDILFIAEADISNHKDLGVFRVQGYEFHCAETLSLRGKCRLVAWAKTHVIRQLDLEDPLNEVIALKIGEVTCLGIYRPFKCYENETIRTNFDRLLNNLHRVGTIIKNLIVIGDWNVDPTRDFGSYFMNRLMEWQDEFLLDQIVNFNTRTRMVAGCLQKSMIDLIYTSVHNLVVNHDFMADSDHVMLRLELGLRSVTVHVKRGVEYLDWRKYSAERMSETFQAMFGGINIHQSDVDNINEKITTAICLSLNELVPKRRANLLGKNPVISPIIRNLRNKKSRLLKKWKRTGDHADYQHLRVVSNQLNFEIKNERKKSLCNALSGTSKDYWKVINSVIGKSVNEGFKIVDRGVEIDNDVEVANLFAEFFKSKVEKLESESSCEQYDLPDLTPKAGNLVTYFNEKDVEQSISLLKSSKAMGFDEVPGIVLKHLKESIIGPLCWLFNNIMDSGVVPKAWKISKITPIHKKGDKSLIANYRPISNISSISKVFER